MRYVEKYCRAGRRPQMTIWRMRIACWVLRSYKYTLRLCNTHCLSTATMVAKTRLNVTLYFTWPVFFFFLKHMNVRNMNVMLFGSGGCVAIVGCNYNDIWRWH